MKVCGSRPDERDQLINQTKRMSKDPAVLLYFDVWISATNGMKAEFRAWYMDLLLYQYDKGSIPNDLDQIAGICRVRPSEYNLFNQMVKQVLEQKFKLNEKGEWENDITSQILKNRALFKEKRSKSGNIGVVIRMALGIKGYNPKAIDWLKKKLYSEDDEKIESYKNNQVLEQMLKLYINGDGDVNGNKGKVEIDTSALMNYEGPDRFDKFWELWKAYKKQQFNFTYKPISEPIAIKKLKKLANNNDNTACNIILQSIENGWQGLFELKTKSKNVRNNTNQGSSAGSTSGTRTYGHL